MPTAFRAPASPTAIQRRSRTRSPDNAEDDALLEIAVGGGHFRFDAPATIVFAGAKVSAEIGGRTVESLIPLQADAGDELVDPSHRARPLRVRRGERRNRRSGRSGKPLDVSPRGIGGHLGRRLQTGDKLRVGSARAPATHAHTTAMPVVTSERIEIVRGPQWDLFHASERERFLATRFTVGASDRAGYRLDGATFEHIGAAEMLSEPTCVGAIQVPNGGSPIVLMQDGPTIGGYPKLAVVRASSLGAFAQRMPGEAVRFAL